VLRFMPLWFLATFTGAMALAIALLSPTEAPASPSTTSSSTATPKPTPTPWYYAGGCDTSDVLASLYGKDKVDQNAPAHLAWMISERVKACREIITTWRSFQTPAPKAVIADAEATQYNLAPPPQGPPSYERCNHVPSNDPMRQYAVLHFCVTWISKYVTPIGSPTPPPIMFSGEGIPSASETWQKNVYVLALASDAPTSAQIAYQLSGALKVRKNPPKDKFTGNPVQYNLVAAPTWQLANFQQQCFNDPSTAGAIVALPPSTQGNNINAVLAWTWTITAWQTIVLECRPTNTAYVNNAVYLSWTGHVQSGKTTSYSVPLASALGILAGILALHPARQGTYAVVTPNPTPPPGNSYQTGYTVGSNNTLGNLAALGVAALTPLSTTSLGQGTEADGQLSAAITNAVPKVASDLESPCPLETSQTPAPTATPQQCNWLVKPR